MALEFELNKCTGCGACVDACPFGVLSVSDGKVVYGEGCTLCDACVEVCPEKVISLKEIAAASVSPAAETHRGVWVMAEQYQGRLKGVSFELIAKGRELADGLKTDLSAVCFGDRLQGLEDLIACGADKVYVIEHPDLAGNPEDLLTYQLIGLVKEYRPEIVLAGATALGRAFIPRVAAALETGLTADCTGLEIDAEKGLLRQTRPTFGGNIMATILCPDRRPQMATVRPRTFQRRQPDASRKGEIVRLEYRPGAACRTKLQSFVEDVTEKIKLDEAEVIVAGGRGLGKPENFKLVQELAQCLGAAVGSSRPPVDEGWISYSHQVGQTGKTVCPKLYIACGISGSVQHMAGMQTADTIVAINSDPNAPIFEIATYGIVGDLFQVIPAMIKEIQDTAGLSLPLEKGG